MIKLKIKFSFKLPTNNVELIYSFNETQFKEEFGEWISDCGMSESEVNDYFRSISCNESEISNFNGNHFIFGWIESLYQSDNCPMFFSDELVDIQVEFNPN